MLERQDDHRQYRLDASPQHREMQESLAETLGRVTGKRGVPLFLTGGVSASLLARDAWPASERPLSRDLDFLVPDDAAVRAALEAEYCSAFVLHTGKAVFKSDKMQAHAGNGMELDFIASSNIVHPDASVAVTVTPLAVRHAERESFLGTEVMTLPPALVVIQKLFAGRGRDLGKFDLLDAESIIRAGRVDPALLRLFFLELCNDDAHRRAVGSRLTAALRRLPSDADILPLIGALQDRPSQAELDAARRSVGEDIRSIDLP